MDAQNHRSTALGYDSGIASFGGYNKNNNVTGSGSLREPLLPFGHQTDSR